MWGVIEFAALVLLAMSGLPIAVALGITGVIFAVLYYGVAGIGLGGITAWATCHSLSMTMIPLFVFMGELISACGVGKDAYDCVYKWLSKLKGSLAIISTVSCAIFGAISGSSAAAIATIGGIGLPEMRRYGYSPALRCGSIANSSILANLIPPSIIAIFYCVLTEVSVGKVFIGGIVPGIILTILFSLITYTWVSLRPSAAPLIAVEGFSLKEKVISLKGPVPIIIIFLGMLGGICAVYAIGLTLIMRRLTRQKFKTAMLGTVRITAFIMLIIMGAMFFAHTIAVTRFPIFVAELIIGSGIPPVGIIFMIILVVIIFGCFLDVFGLIVLTVPLFFPCIVALGFDPVWYGVMTVLLCGIALVTPPMAACLYIAQSVDGEATVGEVMRGVIPFYLGSIALLALIVFFPQIAMWLPSMM